MAHGSQACSAATAIQSRFLALKRLSWGGTRRLAEIDCRVGLDGPFGCCDGKRTLRPRSGPAGLDPNETLEGAMA